MIDVPGVLCYTYKVMGDSRYIVIIYKIAKY